MSQLVQLRSRPFNRLAQRRPGELIIPIRKPGLIELLHPPIWVDPMPALADEFGVPIPAYDAHNALVQGTDPVTFAATGLPTGISIDANTGILSGTPTAVAVFTPEFTATNDVGVDVASTTWDIFTDGDVQSYVLSAGINESNTTITGWLENGNTDPSDWQPSDFYRAYEISEVTHRSDNGTGDLGALRLRLIDTNFEIDFDYFDRITVEGDGWSENFLSGDADFNGPSNNVIWDWDRVGPLTVGEDYAVNIIVDP